ncbi:hypothetical protein ACFLWF_01600 [Chloroflexota bacterium]
MWRSSYFLPRDLDRGAGGSIGSPVRFNWVGGQDGESPLLPRCSERTKAGLARLVAQGKRLGRPPGAKDKRKRRRRQEFMPL